MATFGEQILANSSLTSGTIRELLLHPKESSPSGEIVFKPTDSFVTEISDYNLQANLDIISISLDLTQNNLDGDIPVLILSADLKDTKLGATLCQ